MKTPKQMFYLKCARLLWHDVLDGTHNQNDPWVSRELDRLLRLAKAFRSDL